MHEPDPPAWPEGLDALEAAPGFHRLLLENERIRVLETRIGPGETVPLHTHRWPSLLYVLATADLVRRDAEGRVLTDSREGAPPALGAAVWAGPMAPHTVENVGVGEIRMINVELKD